jgi:hypothetical protein
MKTELINCENKPLLLPIKPLTAGVPKLFWFKPPLTLKIFHAPPPSIILGNQVTNCKKLRIMKIEESLKSIYF